MSLSDESMTKLEEVKCKGVQYIVMKIDELDVSLPVVELETVASPDAKCHMVCQTINYDLGPKGASYDKFVSDLTKSKDCRFGVCSYMVNKKSHPVIFYWTPHEADSLTTLCYTNTNTELKRSAFKGLAEIHVSDPAKLVAEAVTAKLEEFF